MSYTFIPKPTGTNYTNVNTQGKQQYDQPDIVYDQANVFFDSVNMAAYTSVNKPTGTHYTIVNKPTS